MPDITFIHPDGHEDAFEAPNGVSLMQAATSYGVDGVIAECGGSGICGTCHVYVEPAWIDRLPTPQLDETDMLELVAAERRPGSRLACQIMLGPELQGLTLEIPDRQY
jgi:ferredoxin, 2Fe-2S